MNPAAHRRLGATMHVKTNLTFDLRRSDAFYFRGTSFALGYSIFALPSAFLRMFSALLRAFTRIISALA